jgi:hypothetical protein
MSRSDPRFSPTGTKILGSVASWGAASARPYGKKRKKRNHRPFRSWSQIHKTKAYGLKIPSSSSMCVA